jgi:hypothetical protein
MMPLSSLSMAMTTPIIGWWSTRINLKIRGYRTPKEVSEITKNGTKIIVKTKGCTEVPAEIIKVSTKIIISRGKWKARMGGIEDMSSNSSNNQWAAAVVYWTDPKIAMWEGGRASKTFHVCNFGLYVYMFYVYMHTYRTGNLSVYMHTYRHKAKKRIELVVTFYVYMRLYLKKSHFTYFWVKRETHPKFMWTLTFAIWHT